MFLSALQGVTLSEIINVFQLINFNLTPPRKKMFFICLKLVLTVHLFYFLFEFVLQLQSVTTLKLVQNGGSVVGVSSCVKWKDTNTRQLKKQVSQVQVCLLRLRAQSGWRRYSCSDLYSFAFGHSVNGLMFVCVCVIPLIDASIPRTQFPIVHVNVAVVLYPSVCVFETIRLKVLFFFFPRSNIIDSPSR